MLSKRVIISLKAKQKLTFWKKMPPGSLNHTNNTS